MVVVDIDPKRTCVLHSCCHQNSTVTIGDTLVELDLSLLFFLLVGLLKLLSIFSLLIIFPYF